MNAFYQKDVGKGAMILPEEEARHCIQVLRHVVGDSILILDGEGGRFEAEITAISKKTCHYKIISSVHANPRPFRIHLAIAPTKNMERMEWLVEKLTETGVNEISLLVTHHSERRKIRLDRLEKKALSAFKQSKSTLPLPQIHAPLELAAFLGSVKETQKIVAHIDPQNPHIAISLMPHQSVALLVGPEGDFSAEEIKSILAAGFSPASLGSSVLRTETAGFVACQAVNFVNNLKQMDA